MNTYQSIHMLYILFMIISSIFGLFILYFFVYKKREDGEKINTNIFIIIFIIAILFAIIGFLFKIIMVSKANTTYTKFNAAKHLVIN